MTPASLSLWLLDDLAVVFGTVDVERAAGGWQPAHLVGLALSALAQHSVRVAWSRCSRPTPGRCGKGGGQREACKPRAYEGRGGGNYARHKRRCTGGCGRSGWAAVTRGRSTRPVPRSRVWLNALCAVGTPRAGLCRMGLAQLRRAASGRANRTPPNQC